MSGRRDRVDGSIAEIDLGETVRQIGEVVIVLNAVNIESDHLNAGERRELPIAGAMVKVPMRVDYKQRERRGSGTRAAVASLSSRAASDSDLRCRRCR